MLGDYWILIAKSRQMLNFADSRGPENYNFLKQHYE